MAKHNAYLAARDEERQKFFVAGCDTAAQQMFDMLSLALHDPEVMGKGHTIGAERLKRIHHAMYKLESQYHEAWIHTQESDYYQEKLDAALKDVFGEIVPFSERYPYVRDWNYNKPYRGKDR